MKLVSNTRTSLKLVGCLWRGSIQRNAYVKHFHTHIEIITASPMLDPKISRFHENVIIAHNGFTCYLFHTHSCLYLRYISVPNLITLLFHPQAYIDYLVCLVLFFFLFLFACGSTRTG